MRSDRLIFVAWLAVMCMGVGGYGSHGKQPSLGAGTLKVFIVPHSHCDPGWLDTFEAYYNRDVRSILDSVLQSLSSDAAKRFVWAETSFFQRWYEVLSADKRARVKSLIENGQFEFVGGGWVQVKQCEGSASV